MIAANYPSKKRLTESEAEGVLKSGPNPAWFQPWARRAVLMPAATDRQWRYGYAHVTYGDPESAFLHYDVNLFWDRAGLAWALESFYAKHPRCRDQCLGLWFFEPDAPIRLRLSVEPPEHDDSEADE